MSLRTVQITLTSVVLAIFVGGGLLVFSQTAHTRDNLISGCERNNALRQAAYDNFLADAKSRETAATQFTGKAKREILRLAEANRASTQAIVDAAVEDGVAINSGSPRIDCEAAF